MLVNHLLIYPMFAMFLLSALVLIKMFRTRVQAVQSGQVKMSYFKIYNQEVSSDEMIQASRHFTNLFEAPVLFYVVCLLGLLFSEGTIFLILAWIYVISRYAHAYIHIGPNKIMWRMSAYAMSWLVLAAMWLLLVFHQLFPPV